MVILMNELDIFVVLFDCGVDVMQRIKIGVIVFYWVIRYYNMLYVIIYFYLDGNYDLNIVDDYGFIVLYWVVWFKKKFVVQILL